MSNSSFFGKPKEQSKVKIEIVAKYFRAWAEIIIPRAKKYQKSIAYVDLFSGPGEYQNGYRSTPLLILERAIADPEMRDMLITIFNDINPEHTKSLQQAIDSIPKIRILQNKPLVLNKAVGEEILLELERIKSIPKLFFIDPYGYKGLSLTLISSAIKGWGCDCIFFFNYNRINMDLNNQLVKEDMNSLFGKERADNLRERLAPMQPDERESTIVNAIGEALKEVGGSHIQEFCFKNDRGNRTSHYLIFVSKDKCGHSIMKDIMAKEGFMTEEGVPSFEYSSVTHRQLSLFDDYQLIEKLKNMLMDEFAGQTITMIDIYEQHHVGKRYIKKNYKDALLQLEAQGKITAIPAKRKKNTFGDNVQVIFPPKQ
ncbi:three-Cys-motif partner protein TcmP [Aerosakkonemataceae cyanobacterium BLCC-F154]|uniref:Three-Cys-motif partner protein TcmP n=1 Tax=Floridaenema fluviatile BLCC-F154 TaxID=3153640 RepID=A0ABV4YJD8_9CYAN